MSALHRVLRPLGLVLLLIFLGIVLEGPQLQAPALPRLACPPPAAPAPAVFTPPPVAGVYIYFQRPVALLATLRAYREAYPTTHLYAACDDGCHNFTHALARFGAAHDGRAHRITGKQGGSTYMGLAEAPAFLAVLQAALEGMTEPYFILLEDDVRVVRPIASPLLSDINGWAADKTIRGHAYDYILDRNPAAPPVVPLAGFGGAVFRADFFRRLFASIDLGTELDALYNGGAIASFGTDYLLGSLTVAFGGTLGTFGGYLEAIEGTRYSAFNQYGDAAAAVEVVHGFKDFYGAQPSGEDLEVLGAHWQESMVVAQ